VRQARAHRGAVAWLGVNAGYGEDLTFLRVLYAMEEGFVADVHRDRRVWMEDP